MKFQPTFLQSCGYRCPNLLGFHFRPAMYDGIIGETLEQQLRIPLRHPSIKGIMQKQIGQQRADDSALRRALLTRDQLSVLLLHWRFQPAFDIENHPPLRGVFLYRPQKKILIQVVEGSHYTLPIISTFPKKSRLSVLAIRLRAGLSTFFGRHVEKVD